MFNTRNASLEDLNEMRTLFVNTIKSVCKKDYTPEQLEAWIATSQNKARWTDLILNQHAVIAEINKKIVGFGSLKEGHYLDFLYVHKDNMREGIASYIYEELKKDSERLGFSMMDAHVSKTALPFFKKKGFKIINENKHTLNGVEMINFYMSQ